MLERNRKFGRVSRPSDNEALTTGLTPKKQRRSGRAKHAATSQFRLHGKLRREAPIEVLANVPPAIEVVHAAPAIVVADDRNLVTEAISNVDPAASAPDETPRVETPGAVLAIELLETAQPQPVGTNAIASEIPIPSVSPDERLRQRPLARSRRRPILKWAAAACVAAICVVAFGQFSDAHLAAPSAVRPTGSEQSSLHATGNGPPLLQVMTLASPPAEAVLLPPLIKTAAHGTNDLIEAAARPPSADEAVTAREAGAIVPPALRSAAPRRLAPRPVAARAAAPRAATAQGTRTESAQGLIPDFLKGFTP